jgi:hypothetical protein
MKYDDSSFIWLKTKFKIKIASMVLCYFAFPSQRHEESSGKIRLKSGFFASCLFRYGSRKKEVRQNIR